MTNFRFFAWIFLIVGLFLHNKKNLVKYRMYLIFWNSIHLAWCWFAIPQGCIWSSHHGDKARSQTWFDLQSAIEWCSGMYFCFFFVCYVDLCVFYCCFIYLFIYLYLDLNFKFLLLGHCFSWCPCQDHLRSSLWLARRSCQQSHVQGRRWSCHWCPRHFWFWDFRQERLRTALVRNRFI